jgi:hypothetical protein
MVKVIWNAKWNYNQKKKKTTLRLFEVVFSYFLVEDGHSTHITNLGEKKNPAIHE